MTGVVMDASAVIAFLRRESGADRVEPHLVGAAISAVNYAEVVQKGIDAGARSGEVRNAVDLLQLEVVPFDRDQALIAAELWLITRPAGLSMADCCSLALAKDRGQTVLTTDREWKRLPLGIDIDCIR